MTLSLILLLIGFVYTEIESQQSDASTKILARLQALLKGGHICTSSRTVVSTFWFDANLSEINASVEIMRERGWNVSLQEIYVEPTHAADEHYRESTQHCITDKLLLNEKTCLRTIYGPGDELEVKYVLDYPRLHLSEARDSEVAGFCAERTMVIIFGYPAFLPTLAVVPPPPLNIVGPHKLSDFKSAASGDPDWSHLLLQYEHLIASVQTAYDNRFALAKECLDLCQLSSQKNKNAQ